MALIPCAACGHTISAQAPSCPSCGHPGASAATGAREGLARVAGTYISAQMLASIIVGSVAIVSFAAIMIATILKG